MNRVTAHGYVLWGVTHGTHYTYKLYRALGCNDLYAEVFWYNQKRVFYGGLSPNLSKAIAFFFGVSWRDRFDSVGMGSSDDDENPALCQCGSQTAVTKAINQRNTVRKTAFSNGW